MHARDAALAALLFAGAGWAEPKLGQVNVTSEGWWRIDSEAGPDEQGPDGDLQIVPAPPHAAAAPEAPSPELSAPPIPRRPLPVDPCAEIKGRYLRRVLQLYGLNDFPFEDLSPWVQQRPRYGFGVPHLTFPFTTDGVLGPLYGSPPIPPQFLSFDTELREIARELLACQREQLSGE